LEGQLLFLQKELESTYYNKHVTSKLKNVSESADGCYEAGYIWCYYFEVPAGYNTGVSEKRGNKARDEYWPKYSGDIVPDTELQVPYPRPSGDPVLKKDSRGEGVKWMQYILTNYFGYNTGGVDGIFGSKSEESLMCYQTSRNLSADGKLGPKTIAAMVEDVLNILHPVTTEPPVITPEMPYDLAAFAGDNYTTTRFTWAACTDADWYDVRIYKAGEEEAMKTTYNIYDLSYQFPLTAGEYEFSVASVNANGNYQISGKVSFGVSAGTITPVNSAVWNGHIYAVYDTAVWYHDSRRIAKNFGGHLATITSAEENAVIAELIQSGSQSAYLLGGSDEAQEGVWRWETGEAWDYTNWAESQPDNWNDFEHGLEMGKSGVWNDVQLENYTTRGIVVEIEPAAPAAETVFGSNSYQLFDVYMNWTEAHTYCEALGGHLAYVTDAQEQAFLESLITNGTSGAYWLGGLRRENGFEWFDHSALTYTNWGESQPDNWQSAENYMELVKATGKWNDNRNAGARGFICEFEDTNRLELPESIELGIGEQYQIETGGHSLRFKSSNTDVIVVNKSGLLTAVGFGEAVMNVIDENNEVVKIPVTVAKSAPCIAGDVNADGEMNVKDAVLLSRVIAGDSTAEISAAGLVNADVDGSEGLTTGDLTMLLKAICK
jgi:hypothetical protein